MKMMFLHAWIQRIQCLAGAVDCGVHIYIIIVYEKYEDTKSLFSLEDLEGVLLINLSQFSEKPKNKKNGKNANSYRPQTVRGKTSLRRLGYI
jgi:hypothetical protein